MWFVLGFILYALMLAATASLVSRVEEVSSATVPVTMLLVVTWLLAYVVAIPAIDAVTGGGAAPHGLATLTTVLSLIPPFTPVLMSIRMAAGEVPLWQGLLAHAAGARQHRRGDLAGRAHLRQLRAPLRCPDQDPATRSGAEPRCSPGSRRPSADDPVRPVMAGPPAPRQRLSG